MYIPEGFAHAFCVMSDSAEFLYKCTDYYAPASDRSIRWLAAEEVREAAFEALDQEIPYSLAVEVIEFDESRPDLVRIRANLLVERDSQKGIVIGRGGEMIKRIGVRARTQIQKLTGTKVYLELRVKVEPKWAKRPNRLRELGYG